MRKKLKISLLSTLMIGMALSIALPIVSCSQSESSSKTQLTVVKANQSVIDDTALLFTKIGNSNASDNKSPLTRAQFDTVVNADYSSTAASTIWKKLAEVFNFSSSIGNHEFNDVVKRLAIQGIYPENRTTPANLNLTLILNDEFSAKSNDLKITFQLGIRSDEVSLSRGNQSQLNAIGVAFAKTVKPGVLTNEGIISASEYNELIRTTFTMASNSELWNDLGKYFTFRNINNQPFQFPSVVESVTLNGSYPPSGAVKTMIKLNLKPGFQTTSNLEQEVQIGVVNFPLTVTKGNASQLNALGLAFMKIGKPSASVITEGISQGQLTTIINTNYSSSTTPAVWSALGSYFTLRNSANQQMAFNEVVERIIISGTYPTGNNEDVNINLTLNLKPQYIVNNQDSLRQNIKVGARIHPLTTFIDSFASIDEVGKQLARVVNPTTFSNQERITEAQFNTIKGITYNQTSHPEVWNALGEAYSFRKQGNQVVPFMQAVSYMTISGNYPAGEDVTLKVNFILNSTFSAPANQLTQDIRVGKKITILTHSFAGETELNSVATAFHKIVNPAGNYNSPLSRAQFDELKRLDINTSIGINVNRAFDSYYFFNRPTTTGSTSNTGRLFYQNVVDSITLGYDYPNGGAGTNVNLQVRFTLKTGYALADNLGLEMIIKIGVVPA
ncbi:MAG: hypothetical protein ACRCVI_01110 [Mycoplasmoidaceae bacterium]